MVGRAGVGGRDRRGWLISLRASHVPAISGSEKQLHGSSKTPKTAEGQIRNRHHVKITKTAAIFQ